MTQNISTFIQHVFGENILLIIFAYVLGVIILSLIYFYANIKSNIFLKQQTKNNFFMINVVIFLIIILPVLFNGLHLKDLYDLSKKCDEMIRSASETSFYLMAINKIISIDFDEKFNLKNVEKTYKSKDVNIDAADSAFPSRETIGPSGDAIKTYDSGINPIKKKDDFFHVSLSSRGLTSYFKGMSYMLLIYNTIIIFFVYVSKICYFFYVLTPFFLVASVLLAFIPLFRKIGLFFVVFVLMANFFFAPIIYYIIFDFPTINVGGEDYKSLHKLESEANDAVMQSAFILGAEPAMKAFLTMGLPFYDKYKKRKNKPEGIVGDSNIKQVITIDHIMYDPYKTEEKPTKKTNFLNFIEKIGGKNFVNFVVQTDSIGFLAKIHNIMVVDPAKKINNFFAMFSVVLLFMCVVFYICVYTSIGITNYLTNFFG